MVGDKSNGPRASLDADTRHRGPSTRSAALSAACPPRGRRDQSAPSRGRGRRGSAPQRTIHTYASWGHQKRLLQSRPRKERGAKWGLCRPPKKGVQAHQVPPPPHHPAFWIIPFPEAIIGVPVGAAKSVPLCILL